MRGVLKRFGTDETKVSEKQVIDYLQTSCEEIDLVEVIGQWRAISFITDSND